MSEPPDLDGAIAALESDKALARDDRDTGAPDDDLDWAVDLLRQAQRHLDAGNLPAAADALARVVRQAIDAWALTSEISEQIAGLKEELDKLVG